MRYLTSMAPTRKPSRWKILGASAFSAQLHRELPVVRSRADREKRLELRFVPRKCLHYCFYLQHPRFGYARPLQSWFPFDMRCLNGREWLCRELDRAGIGYVRRENCLIDVADLPRAQRLLDMQSQTNWTNRRFAALVHPFACKSSERGRSSYYWSLDESEWASDVMFRSPRLLAELYPRLVRHAVSNFGSRDVMRFLGRKVPATGVSSRNRWSAI